MNIPHKTKVLIHLEQGKSLTQREAIELFNCYRLSAVIYNLRRAGYVIETYTELNDSGIGTHARYELIGGSHDWYS